MSTATVPIIWPDDTARARRTDPVTSHEAADTSDVSKSIGLVLSILQDGELTDHELAVEARSRGEVYTEQRLRTARAALVESGAVESAGFYRLTPHGRRAIVWQVAS